MHFSALAEFTNSQVLHFHPPLSEGGFSPAAPQLNPPPVPLLVVVLGVVPVEGVGPNPVKLGLNPDPAGLGAPNENPDEGVDIDEAPNRSGPEGGVGIEKTLPELELEEEAPGLGASQTVHFSLADAGFFKSQVPHFHSSVFAVVVGFNPAALQLNPPELVEVVVVKVAPEPKTGGAGGGFGMESDVAVVEGFSAPGFGASHTVHFSVADAGFTKPQVSQFQPSVFGGFNPAAPQLNPPELEFMAVVAAVVAVVVELAPKERGVEGGLGIEREEDATGFAAPGLEVSHTVHFSVAEAGFIRSQVPHFHPSSCFKGGFKPAAPQLNPPLVAGAGAVVGEVGRGGNVEVKVKSALVLEPVL